MNDASSYPGTSHNYLNQTIPIILLIIILFFSAWVRFDGIAEQGVLPGADGFKYIKEAKLWAAGEPPEFLNGKFYRPAAYSLMGMAIKIFGYNDYSIKMMNGILDVLSILLIFVIASILAKNLWVGTASSLIYAFLPGVFRLVRMEMIHVESTFFVLLTLFFLFYLLAGKPGIVLNFCCFLCPV